MNLIRFFTFMSFMMSWKSPPKALHSFSIPASIFPQARKNPPQLPNTQTFYLQKKSFQPSLQITPREESMEAFFNLIGRESYNTLRAKSTFCRNSQKQQWKRRKNTHGSKIQVEGNRRSPTLVSRCYRPANSINVRENTTS